MKERVRKVSEIISPEDKNRCDIRNVVRRDVNYKGPSKGSVAAYTSNHYRL